MEYNLIWVFSPSSYSHQWDGLYQDPGWWRNCQPHLEWLGRAAWENCWAQELSGTPHDVYRLYVYGSEKIAGPFTICINKFAGQQLETMAVRINSRKMYSIFRFRFILKCKKKKNNVHKLPIITKWRLHSMMVPSLCFTVGMVLAGDEQT